jgi:hypothetical protein
LITPEINLHDGKIAPAESNYLFFIPKSLYVIKIGMKYAGGNDN